MIWTANWIKPHESMGDIAPMFSKSFVLEPNVQKAELYVTALGVYEAELNGVRVGEYILAPGWTTYRERLQYQCYDVTELLQKENTLTVSVGKGWYRCHMGCWDLTPAQEAQMTMPVGLLAQLVVSFLDGKQQILGTDESWCVFEGPVRFSEIYDGEHYDANVTLMNPRSVEIFDGPFHTLIPQEGEEIHKQEVLYSTEMFVTPKGELVVDFGQEITGYVVTSVNAKKGDVVDLSFAEVMDKNGNFYTENYRAAKAEYRYICRDGSQTYEPKHTFWGFRYIRVNAFPGGLEKVTPGAFCAVVIHSDLKRTGRLSCSDPCLNRFFSNVVWGQKGNFLDVPTDCPQRDERLGWTGDAQIFARAAALNFDVEKFYAKWLKDLAAEQRENGYIPHVIPDALHGDKSSSAWGDASTICPWQIYLAYGNPKILADQFESMCKWIHYITSTTTTQYLWTGGEHFGDWLGLDAPSGSYKGSSRDDFIASAYYAYSTELVIKAGKVLGEDVSEYEVLYENIVNNFRQTYPIYYTQTECVLAAYFRLAEDCQAAADQLAKLVETAGGKLMTGFVGTPYLLHVLSEYGYSELAYSLLLRTDYPSWLYPVCKGATTVWEHWDGIMENGDFWSKDMNSFNHYAYGAVTDWVYTVAAGIQTVEEAPGYKKVRIAPTPDARLDWLQAELDTRHGRMCSAWKKADKGWLYEITTPVESEIIIDKTTHRVSAGSYLFYSSDK